MRGAPPLRFGDETRYRVEQMDRIAGLRQPEGIGSGRTADVHDSSRCGGRVALDQLSRAEGFEQEGTLFEPAFLGRLAIVLGNSRIKFRRLFVHAVSPSGRPNYK